jgi:hypothetical protein
VAAFTRAYESARFGNSVDDAQSLPGLFEEIADDNGRSENPHSEREEKKKYVSKGTP